MKERSKEKIVTENLKVEKKACPAVEKSKLGNSLKSKSEVKTSKTKISVLQEHSLKLKNNRPKSRSSSLLEKLNHCHKKRQNSGENKSARDKVHTLNKFENAKKHRSLVHVGCSSLRDDSGKSVAKKVSNVLQQGKNSRIFLRDCSNHLLLPKTLHSYPSKLNFLAHKHDYKQQDSVEKQATEKSQSYHAIKIANKARRPCKCISVENNKNLTNVRQLGIFNVRNKSYRQKSDPFVKILNPSDPLWNRIQYLNSQCMGKNNNDSEELNSGSQINQTRILAADIKHENKKNVSNEKISFHSLANNSEPTNKGFGPVKGSNDQLQKKPLKICQCLHFHTEDGIQKFSFQNNSSGQEVGQKLFRVKYVSKKEDEENDQTESKEAVTEKERISEIILTNTEDLKSSKSRIFSNRKHQARIKSGSKTSIKSSFGKTETEKPEENKNLSSIFEGIENQKEIPDAFRFRKNNTPILSKQPSDTKAKLQEEAEEKNKSPRISQDISVENSELKKAKEELAILKKLFSKLNSLDSSTFKEEAVAQQKKPSRNSPRTLTKKWRGSQALAEKACEVLKDIEAEEKLLREKNKLRYKIIRHVQNFIKLEFSES